jgi:protein required for attachment to host cells
MAITWILVANASGAKIYANRGINKGLEKQGEFSHPDSRKKSSELVTDRAGHMQSVGNGHGARQPAANPKQSVHENFARKLAQYLEQSRAANMYERLILVAEPHFRGLINSALGAQVRSLISGAIDRDYTKVSDRELAGHLGRYILI